MKKNSEITIIGAGLTGLTLAFLLKRAGKKVLVVEKNNYVGGVIQTIEKEGFIYETGPNTGVLSNPELIQLFDLLKEKCELETANKDSKSRWIWKKEKWNPLPSGPISAISTPLFTLKDKFRILGEPFRKRGTNSYETVAELVKRRMGNSFLDYAVDPFISGIYAGDPNKLITKFALPKLYNLEQKYGSFIRGAAKKAKEPKTELEKRATKEVFSAKGGLQKLIKALTDEIGKESILLDCKDVNVEKTDSGFCTKFSQDSTIFEINSKIVVLTVGAHALPELLPFISAEKLKNITNLEYAKVVLAVAGYKKWQGIPLPAFGGLIPTKEKRNALGILFPSSIFENRTPEGGALLSVFMGGIKRPDIFNKSDNELKEIALKEISETLDNSENTPNFVEIYKYDHAIPQYDEKSKKRLEAIAEIESENEGLILAGNIRDGIGMADRVKQSFLIAEQISILENKQQKLQDNYQ